MTIENWDYATPEMAYEEVRSLQGQLEAARRRADAAEALLRRLVEVGGRPVGLVQQDRVVEIIAEARKLLLEG